VVEIARASTLEEYLYQHPEYCRDGQIFCTCNASNIRTLDDPMVGKMHVCAVCNKILFVEQQSPKST